MEILFGFIFALAFCPAEVQIMKIVLNTEITEPFWNIDILSTLGGDWAQFPEGAEDTCIFLFSLVTVLILSPGVLSLKQEGISSYQ